MTMKQPATYAKATAAAITGAAAAFGSALLPYLDAGLQGVTAYGWDTAGIAAIVAAGAAFGITYNVPNTQPPGD